MNMTAIETNGNPAMWVEIQNYSDPKICHKHVYVGEFDGALKIGVSIQPKKRLSTLASISGRTLIKARVLIADGPYNAFRTERYIHDLLADYRLEGEWFHLDALGEIPKLPMVEIIEGPENRGDKMDQRGMFLGYHFMAVASAKNVRDHRVDAIKSSANPMLAAAVRYLRNIAKVSGGEFCIHGGEGVTDILDEIISLMQGAHPDDRNKINDDFREEAEAIADNYAGLSEDEWMNSNPDTDPETSAQILPV